MTIELYQKKKLAGICIDCTLPALFDNMRCEGCRARNLVNQKAYAARNKEFHRLASKKWRERK